MSKVIGILGGLSPESTVIYYRYIVEEYTKRFNDYSYPEIIIYSVTFQDYVNWQKNGEWEKAASDMAEKINSMEQAGADFALIASNTMHIVFDQVQSHVSLPLINIIDITAEAIQQENIKKVALLGTKFTMSGDFYQQRFNSYGIDILTPSTQEQENINEIIFNQLCKGKLLPSSKRYFLNLVKKLIEKGANGVICGCTEIPLLLKEEDTPVKLFNTTTLHAEKALQKALS